MQASAQPVTHTARHMHVRTRDWILGGFTTHTTPIFLHAHSVNGHAHGCQQGCCGCLLLLLHCMLECLQGRPRKAPPPTLIEEAQAEKVTPVDAVAPRRGPARVSGRGPARVSGRDLHG